MTTNVSSYLTYYENVRFLKNLMGYCVHDNSWQINWYKRDVGKLKLLFSCIGQEGGEEKLSEMVKEPRCVNVEWKQRKA